MREKGEKRGREEAEMGKNTSGKQKKVDGEEREERKGEKNEEKE